MRQVAVVLFFVFTILCFAEEKSDETPGIKFDLGDVSEPWLEDWSFDVDLQSNPTLCASNRFEYNGGNFICLKYDRLLLIMAQRDFEYATKEWYRHQVIAKNAYSIMDELQRIARETCRKDGKKFSEQTALCEGALQGMMSNLKGER